jgi:hypothetical protein
VRPKHLACEVLCDWMFEHMAGNLVLIKRMLDGDWGGDFLALEPGQQIAMSYDDDVI